MIVYVYATDSHTEIAIKDFLRKIRTDIQWIIKSPSLPKRSKHDYENKEAFPILTGRTGADLEKFMMDELELHPSILTECAAVLLEDDVDFRDKDTNQKTFLQQQETRLNNELKKLNTKSTTALICMYAAPEIETWLIEDWENSFGNPKRFNPTVATQLKTSINQIRTSCNNTMESYSHHHQGKLSDWIITKTKDLAQSDKDSIYSKRKHGSIFLSNIDPEKVANNCRTYFARAYHNIQSL